MRRHGQAFGPSSCIGPMIPPRKPVADASRNIDLTSWAEYGHGREAGRVRAQARFPEGEADFQAAVRRALDYAACWRQGNSRMAGVVPPDAMCRGERILVGNLKIAAERPETSRCWSGADNRRDRPGYFYSSTGEATEMIGRRRRSNLKHDVRLYHVGIAKATMSDPAGEAICPRSVTSRSPRCRAGREPDEGEIDYRGDLDAVVALGYAGWVGCEYKPRGDTTTGLTWIRELGIDWPPRNDTR